MGASFNYKLRKDYPKRNGQCAIRLYVTINSKPYPIPTNYSVLLKEWDEAKGKIKPNHHAYIEWNQALDVKLKEAKRMFAILDAQGRATGEALKNALSNGDSFYALAKKFEEQFRKDGKIGTADNYKKTAKTIEELYPGIKIGEMNNHWAEEYKAMLEGKGYEKNTIVSKLRAVNAILAKTVGAGIFPVNPMADVKKGSYRAAKGNRLTKKELDKLWRYLPSGKWDFYAKWCALMSYYMSGARFKDVLLMPKDALYVEDGISRIKWAPHKTSTTTGIELQLPVSDKLKQVIAALKNDTQTIAGIISDEAINEVKQAEQSRKDTKTKVDLGPTAQVLDKEISRAEQEINKALKRVMLACGIGKPISFHDIRRSFSKHLQDMDNDIYSTKNILGHDKVSTTEGYIGVDQKVNDEKLSRLYGG